MKVNTTMIELVIMITLMCCSIPFLATLLTKTHTSKFQYLDDKSVVEESMNPDMYDLIDITKESVDAPSYRINGRSTVYDYELCPYLTWYEAMMIPIMQDDYVPEDANYRYLENYQKGKISRSLKSPWSPVGGSEFYADFQIVEAWRQSRVSYQMQWKEFWTSPLTTNSNRDYKYYLKWVTMTNVDAGTGATTDMSGWVLTPYPITSYYVE